MTYPRSHTVNSDVGCTFLCTSRCVRRAFLLGHDPVTGHRTNHRKDWIEQRLLFLTEVFAVEVTGFAVMDNHYHAVLRTVPERAAEWSDEEVADRWLKLSPRASETVRSQRRVAILSNTDRLRQLRARLVSLSWYMKSLNEAIARRANLEDNAKGRFWEGRFHCEALLDQAAVTAAMAYVDLNPVRAGVVDDPSKAIHTALRRRLSAERHGGQHQLTSLSVLGLTVERYLDLLSWTLNRDGRGKPPESRECLHSLRCQPLDWLQRYDGHAQRRRARGAEHCLKKHAQQLRQRWLWGLPSAPKT